MSDVNKRSQFKQTEVVVVKRNCDREKYVNSVDEGWDSYFRLFTPSFLT